MNREEAVALIERQFLGDGLSPTERARLFEEVRRDAALKAVYDRYAAMEAGLADGRTDAMRARILAAVAAEAAPTPAPIPFLARPGRRAAIAAGLVALAAVALVSVMPSGQSPDAPPRYDLALSAGAQALRGQEQASLRFEPNTRMQLILRPERATSLRLKARAALVSAEQEHPARAAWEAAGGAFKLEGTAGALFEAPPGRYELVVVVGSPGALPERLAGAQSSDTVQVFRRPVRWGPQ